MPRKSRETIEMGLMYAEPFWITEPGVLLQGANVKRFLPTAHMDFHQRLNAITRFCMYLFCILFLLSDNHTWLYIPLLGTLCMVLIWVVRDAEEVTEGFTDPNVLDGRAAPYQKRDGRIIRKLLERKRPTYENPFMNHTMSDYDGDKERMAERLSLQPEQWTKVKADVDKKYYQGMYRNTSDVYEQESAKRSFYQMPATTVPNDQDSFAKWCYRAPTVCKESGEGCVRYADPRAERRVAQSEYII